MYAVIQSGGKQYRVQEGDVLRVASLGAEAGGEISFDDVLLTGEGDTIKVGADVAGASVMAEVLAHGLGKKVEVFKKRRRKNSQRTQGHRQAYTSVRITKVGAADAAGVESIASESAAVGQPGTGVIAAKEPGSAAVGKATPETSSTKGDKE